MSMISKEKKPERVYNPYVAEIVKGQSNRIISTKEESRGFRFDCWEVVFQLPNGKETTHHVTLSQASAEILTLYRQDGKWCFIFGRQARSPYMMEIDGKLYSKLFFEQAAGLLEEGQDFVQAAIAETSQEFGVTLSYLGVLISKVCRHVSYSDETSVVFLAVADSIGKQRLDKYENIEVVIIPVDETREEFEAYLDGDKDSFFGFDIPEMTQLSLSKFFWKLDTGKLDLDNLQGNLLK